MIDETAEEIADMQTHSSSVVAVKAAHALRSMTTREFPTVDEYYRGLEQNSSALRRANRSHASLHTTQREIVERVLGGEDDSVETAQARTNEVIDEIVTRVETSKDRAATEAATVLEDGDTVLTHDYSTTVLSTIEKAVEDGCELTVYVTESRPRFIGRKMARSLAVIDDVETNLIVDSAAGHYLPDCDHVLVGMTCIVDDVLYNRVGTYPLAATAADAGVSMTTVGSGSKIIRGGFRFENEYRIPSEVMREPAEGFEIENPAYDATPMRLLDSVVTDDGAFDAEMVEEL